MTYYSWHPESQALNVFTGKRERTAWCERTGAQPVTKAEAMSKRPGWSAADWRRFVEFNAIAE